jgi:hypothetical protein
MAVLWSIRPLLLGRGILVLTDLQPGTTLTLDGQPLTEQITQPLSGRHQLQILRPGYYPLGLELTITRAQTTTLSLPALRPRPAVQPIPLPAPGAAWQIAYPDPLGGWRLTATTADLHPTPAPGDRLFSDQPAPNQSLLHLDALGVTRLAALEAYAAADEQVSPAGRFWAVWEPLHADFRSERGQLTITTPETRSVITTTATVTGLWWAPGGRELLIAEHHGIGQDLLLWSVPAPAIPPSAPLVSIPGRVAAVHWNADGRAAVVLSTTRERDEAQAAPQAAKSASPRWEATLLLLPPAGDAPRTLRLAPPPAAPLGLVPMAWSADALLWTADMGQYLMLERIPFATALPARMGTVPEGTIAVCVRGNQEVRLLVRDGARTLTVQTWPAHRILFALDEIDATPRMGALWRDTDLLLASGERDLWLLTFALEALRCGRDRQCIKQ